MCDKQSDSVLLAAFINGSEEAFGEIVSRYTERVFNLAFRIARNQEDAEDISQDVFTTVFTKAHTFQGKSAFSSWIYRITANTALMKLRKRKSTQVVCMDDELEDLLENLLAVDELSAESAERFELREAIESALVALPDDYRAIFIMRDVDRLSNEDVASYMGLSVPAVKSRLHRSRLFLRKRLQKLFTEQSEYTPMVLSRASNMGRGMSKEQ